MSEETRIKMEQHTPRAEAIGVKMNQIHVILQDEQSSDAATALINLAAIYLVTGRTADQAIENARLGSHAIIIAAQHYFAKGYGAASEYETAPDLLAQFVPEGKPN